MIRPSELVKPLIRWVPYDDGRPGLHPTRPYDTWARLFSWENRVQHWWHFTVMRRKVWPPT